MKKLTLYVALGLLAATSFGQTTTIRDLDDASQVYADDEIPCDQTASDPGGQPKSCTPLLLSSYIMSLDDVVGPDMLLSAGQTDEYCLTYEATGDTWEWQSCGSGAGDMLKSVYDASPDDNVVDTAAALAANGSNCSAGEIPLGVDASGAVEGCYEPAEADISDLDHTATAITDGLIVEADLNEDSGTPTDEDVLTFDSTGNNFNWIAQSSITAGEVADGTRTDIDVSGGSWTIESGAVDSTAILNDSVAVVDVDSDTASPTAGYVLSHDGAGAFEWVSNAAGSESDPTLTDDDLVTLGDADGDDVVLTFDAVGDGTITWKNTEQEFWFNAPIAVPATASPAFTLTDSDAEAATDPVALSIGANLTDPGDGTEDADVTMTQLVGGSPTAFLTADADGSGTARLVLPDDSIGAAELDAGATTDGYHLTWNTGDTLTWEAAGTGSGTPGGSDAQVQFNDGGSTFGGDAGLTYNKTTDALTVGVGSSSLISGSATGIWLDPNGNTVTIGDGTNQVIIQDDGDLLFDGSASFVLKNSLAPSLGLAGEMELHTDALTAQGIIEFHDGTNNPAYIVSTVDTPSDNEIPKYDSGTGQISWEADAGAAGGDSVSIDGVGVTDPDFVSTGDIDFVDTSNTVTANLNADVVAAAEMADADHGDISWSSGVASVDADVITQAEIADDAVEESHLKSVNAATDEYCLTYESTTGDFEWETCGSGSGDVVGPASATDEAIARFDSTTGKLLQDSSVTISDAGVLGINVGAADGVITGPGSTYDLHIDANGENVTIGDGGTNGIQVSEAGALTFIGNGDIDLPNDSVDAADVNFNYAASGSEAGSATSVAADVIDASHMADADHGDVAWSSGVASVQAVGNNTVDLGTDTIGDYVSTATASQGLLVTGTEGASVGFQDCAANEVLKRNSGDTAWECAADSTGGSPAFNDITSGTNTLADMVVGNGAAIELEEGGEIEANEVIIFAQNETGATIYKCSAVHIHTFDVPSALPAIVVADADDALLMPATGIMYETVADGASGRVMLSGMLTGADTTTGTWAVGDRVYVNDSGTSTGADCGETLTNTKPANTGDLLQAIATVVRTHGTLGKLVVSGAGRSNDVPILQDDYFWLGNGSNVATAVQMSGDATMTNAGVVTVVDDSHAHTATTISGLDASDTTTGTFTHERGGLEADVSGYTDGLFGMASGVTTDIDTLAELNTAISSGLVTGAHTTGATITSIAAGAYAAASIDGDDINSNIAGTHLTLTAGSPDTLDVDSELKTVSECVYIEDPETDEEFLSLHRAAVNYTVTAIWCEAIGGTSVALDLEIDDGTPAAVNNSAISCTSTASEDSSLAGDVNYDDGDRMDLDLGTVTGTVTSLSVCWEATIDD